MNSKLLRNDETQSQRAADVKKRFFGHGKLDREVSDHTLATGSVEDKSTVPGTSIPNQVETASAGFTIGAFSQVKAMPASSEYGINK